MIDKDLDALAPWAVRYALGRRSYVVSDVCDVLTRRAADLSPTIRRVILDDIRESRDLGDDMDVVRWLALRETLRALQD